ncbi:MAG: hypothetical protein ABR530_11095 [Pyrinomonadaceae bacterium]
MRTDLDAKYDRQIRAFGGEGQHLIELLKSASSALEVLAPSWLNKWPVFGVSDLVLIDDDQVEASNISRVLRR